MGYCLGSGLLREDRRAHEKRLVKLWHEELCREACLADYSFQEAWHHYKLGHLTGVTMAIMAAMHVGRTERGDEMFWAMAIRHYEALQDLDLDALLARYEV